MWNGGLIKSMTSTCEISELVVIAVHEAGTRVAAGGTIRPELLDEELQRGTAKGHLKHEGWQRGSYCHLQSTR
ncbi:hypothetical protein M404DRAFT_644874 [Pisolithus tinctorius Marx 270]|uniref:Uncharacterized protein n=1 Tax=Pisolithus tinctorius Marx 270 TaxID=870435 RepID=A0A0C3P5H9_PISTI|nr:hypothetical protein M404DRAFT_644874 [Pisolithus tinctorius Marx 270]